MDKLIVKSYQSLISCIYVFDYPEYGQYLFQDSASPVMEGIIDFHHDLTGILIWIGLFVLWMVVRVVWRYKMTYHSVVRPISLLKINSKKDIFVVLNFWKDRFVGAVLFTVLKYDMTQIWPFSRTELASNFEFWAVNYLTNLTRTYRIHSWADLSLDKMRTNFNDQVGKRVGLPIVHDTSLEIVWTVVPAFILMGIAIPSFALLYAMDELVAPLLTLKIVGRQWYWQYEYSDHSTNYSYESRICGDAAQDWSVPSGFLRLLDVDKTIVLPEKVHVRLLITAADVLHSFAVPSLGVKLDACPGRLNQTALYSKRVGLFYGQCSEICGVNHAFMPIAIDVVSFDDYTKWYLSHKSTLHL